MHDQTINLISSFSTGVIQAPLFNPCDRALYLSIKEKRAFLDSHNWKNPYQGFSNSIISKSLSCGSYFWLINYFADITNNAFIAGVCTGSISAIISNPVSVVRYQMWGNESRPLYSMSKEMYLSGGIKPFFKGCGSGIQRDAIFGGVFLFGHEYWEKIFFDSKYRREKIFISDTCSAFFATALSSPFNFIMNHKYRTKPNELTPSALNIMSILKSDIIFHQKNKIIYTTNRLMIGWGTMRVGVGMAFGYQVYDMIKNQLKFYTNSH